MLESKSKQIILGFFIVVILLWSGLFATTFATVNQALPTMALGLTGLVSVFVWRKSEGHSALMTIVLLLLIYLGWRAYSSDVKEYAYQDLFLILSGGIVFLIQSRTEGKLWFHKVVVLGILLLVILNFLMFVPSVNAFRDNMIDYANGTHQSGLFNHKNFFANFMGMSMCLCLALALWVRSLTVKLIAGLMVLGCIGAVFYSANRAASISLVICLFIILSLGFWDLKLFKRYKYTSILFSLVAIVGAGVISYSIISSRTSYHPGFKAQSTGRVDCWSIAVSQVPDAPLVGSGPRSFEYKSYEYWPDSLGYYMEDFKFVHSEYLQMLGDYGLIGFILSILFIVVFLFYSFSRIVAGNLKGFQQACLVAGLSAFIFTLIHSGLSFPLHGYVNIIFLAYLSGFVFLSSGKNGEGEVNKFKLGQMFSAFCLAGLSIVALVLPVPEYKAGEAMRQYGIMGDDMNWSPAEQSEKDWLSALETAHAASPRFSRAQKLGVLYMDEFIRLGVGDELAAKAETYFNESIQLNPYNVVPEFNLAALYLHRKDYTAAERMYLHIDRRYKERIRDNYYRYERKLDSLYFAWLSSVFHEGKEDEIRKVLSKFAKHKELRVQDNYVEGRLVECMEQMALARLSFSEGDRKEGYSSYDKFLKYGRSFHGRADLLEWHIDGLIDHSNFVWFKHRNSKRALFFFRQIIRKRKILIGLVGAGGQTNKRLDAKLAKVAESIEILEGAGFK